MAAESTLAKKFRRNTTPCRSEVPAILLAPSSHDQAVFISQQKISAFNVAKSTLLFRLVRSWSIPLAEQVIASVTELWVIEHFCGLSGPKRGNPRKLTFSK